MAVVTLQTSGLIARRTGAQQLVPATARVVLLSEHESQRGQRLPRTGSQRLTGPRL